jgi:IMP dehydrogenase/GMP reductase
MLAAFDESCAPWEKDEETGKVTRLYYGMSTKKAQKLMNAAAQNPIPEDKLNLKTSEGTFKHLEPQGKISKWTDNLQSYIRSTMSYCDCRTLEEFTSGKVKVITKSPATTNAINK